MSKARDIGPDVSIVVARGMHNCNTPACPIPQGLYHTWSLRLRGAEIASGYERGASVAFQKAFRHACRRAANNKGGA